jgi:hypothetical protein
MAYHTIVALLLQIIKIQFCHLNMFPLGPTGVPSHKSGSSDWPTDTKQNTVRTFGVHWLTCSLSWGRS